ncbi:uncharacterized protein LOC129004452 [Macrosteles quadrilineatus]|uniref:uncharacterized protein LOC129004452 n=1 Tax=Macrosteles quadrilineatus TaxID=74068 RepID=UPI0023E1375C|nr:uncharacterized protein LOC129004452 [Macrosteles quadrilineatus]
MRAFAIVWWCLLLWTLVVGAEEEKREDSRRENHAAVTKVLRETKMGSMKENQEEKEVDKSKKEELIQSNTKRITDTTDGANYTVSTNVNCTRDDTTNLNSLNNLDKGTETMDLEEFHTESVTTEDYDPKKFERRSDDFEGGWKVVRETSPRLDKDMIGMAFKSDEVSKVQSLINKQHDPKRFQRRTFDIIGMLGFKNKKYDAVVTITKEEAIPVPYNVVKTVPVPVAVQVERPIPVEVEKAYPVTVEKKVYYPVKEYIQAPYPVYKKVPYLVRIAVENPVPVHIDKPYPVYIERKVPYPVERQIHYPVKIPVERRIPIKIPVVKNMYYPVEKKVPYPVPVPEEKPVAVPVENPYPVYVEKQVPVFLETHFPSATPAEEHKPEEPSPQNIGHADVEDSFVPSEPIEIDFQNNENKVVEGGFVPIVNHDPTKLQDKKDEAITLEEPKKKENKPAEVPLISETITRDKIYKENNHKNINKTTEKHFLEFGKKIKKL